MIEIGYSLRERFDKALDLAERWVKTREQGVKLREQELKVAIARVKGRSTVSRVMDGEED